MTYSTHQIDAQMIGLTPPSGNTNAALRHARRSRHSAARAHNFGAVRIAGFGF